MNKREVESLLWYKTAKEGRVQFLEGRLARLKEMKSETTGIQREIFMLQSDIDVADILLSCLPGELETVVRLRLVERTKWDKMERAYQKKTGTWMPQRELRRCYRQAMDLLTEEPEGAGMESDYFCL